MNGHTVAPLRPRTGYQVQNEIVAAAHEKIREAYARGVAHGREQAEVRGINGALFLGFAFGVAISATLVAVVTGWPL